VTGAGSVCAPGSEDPGRLAAGRPASASRCEPRPGTTEQRATCREATEPASPGRRPSRPPPSVFAQTRNQRYSLRRSDPGTQGGVTSRRAVMPTGRSGTSPLLAVRRVGCRWSERGMMRRKVGRPSAVVPVGRPDAVVSVGLARSCRSVGRRTTSACRRCRPAGPQRGVAASPVLGRSRGHRRAFGRPRCRARPERSLAPAAL
jgi:hypothetical protein